MTKKEAIEYLLKVIKRWGSWCKHHKKLVEAIEVLIEGEN